LRHAALGAKHLDCESGVRLRQPLREQIDLRRSLDELG
jgi:hypothetical protein